MRIWHDMSLNELATLMGRDIADDPVYAMRDLLVDAHNEHDTVNIEQADWQKIIGMAIASA